MKNRVTILKTSFSATLLLISLVTFAQVESDRAIAVSNLFPKGQKVPAGNFTGTAWVYQLIEPDSTFSIPVGNVTFEPGARTFWHSHPGGQALLATGGIGYYQEKGKPIRILRPGDSVKCPADTPHWHGASPETGFTQVAVTPNTPKGRVTWLQEVTDQEYRGLKK